MSRIQHDHIFLISDLHLGDPLGEVDHFHSDSQLLDFLLAYIPLRTMNERATLIIHGDFLDFPRVAPCYKELSFPRVGCSERESVMKARRMIEGHPTVFTGLRALLRRGDQLLVLAGNHDIDLYWPDVRAELCKELQCSEGAFGFVHEGALRERGIYVQHGHQLSYENRFEQWPPHPFEHNGEQRLERCWGTFFMEGVYNLAEAFAPWIGMVHPTWRAVYLALKNLEWGKIPPPIAGLFLSFFATFGKRLSVELTLSDGELWPRKLEELADEFGLEGKVRAEALVRAQALLDTQRPVADPDAETPVGGRTLGRTNERGIARAAHEALSRPDVHTVIVGHTHAAEQEKSTAFASKVMINTGTWTGYVPVSDWSTVTFEELEQRAREPVHRRTFAYVGPNAIGVLEDFEG